MPADSKTYYKIDWLIVHGQKRLAKRGSDGISFAGYYTGDFYGLQYSKYYHDFLGYPLSGSPEIVVNGQNNSTTGNGTVLFGTTSSQKAALREIYQYAHIADTQPAHQTGNPCFCMSIHLDKFERSGTGKLSLRVKKAMLRQMPGPGLNDNLRSIGYTG